MSSEASAPGKIVLLGEYAVLAGGTALVAAVNRRAEARFVEGASASASASAVSSSVVDAVLACAADEGCGVEPVRAGRLDIDTKALQDVSGVKLGLGSSAAVAVVASALATGRGDEVALRIAIDGHRRAFQGEGSGIDVAASFFGGVIATKRQPCAVEPLASRLSGYHLHVLFTGQSASTSEFVARCKASPKFGDWVLVMSRIAEQGIEAYRKQHALAFLRCVAEYGRAMSGLGKDAGVPIVSEQIEDIMTRFAEAGGAAKPSGAGGGDVVIAWSSDEDVVHRIAEQTSSRVVELKVDARGLVRNRTA